MLLFIFSVTFAFYLLNIHKKEGSEVEYSNFTRALVKNDYKLFLVLPHYETHGDIMSRRELIESTDICCVECYKREIIHSILKDYKVFEFGRGKCAVSMDGALFKLGLDNRDERLNLKFELYKQALLIIIMPNGDKNDITVYHLSQFDEKNCGYHVDTLLKEKCKSKNDCSDFRENPPCVIF